METYLELIWYFVICASVMFYIVLDGFDLGVGCVHLFCKGDEERRVFLNAIGPVWDGNEVWLVVIGGALFAGFPMAYATLCSAFYTPIMILLAGIIFRAVAIEFRSKLESARWRKIWDGLFSLASIVMTFSFGVVLGNLVEGIPLDSKGDYLGTFSEFFTPFPVLIGLTAIALFSMHGIIYLVMKTENDLHEKLRRWVSPSILCFVILFAVLTMATLIYKPTMAVKIKEYPVLFLVPVLAILSFANVIRCSNQRKDGSAFLFSCLSIALLFVLFGLGTFPNIIQSSGITENSITIFNSASSVKTLKVILTVACIGVPLVLAYGIWIYHIFRGKVKMDHHSY